ncbi:hypothetical protein SK128_020966, partial [Halocaridina rubra]
SSTVTPSECPSLISNCGAFRTNDLTNQSRVPYHLVTAATQPKQSARPWRSRNELDIMST